MFATFVLHGGSVSYYNSVSKTAFKSAILVSLISTDLHALQLDERIMTGISDTHIQVGANAFIDEEGNSLVESASLQGATFVPIARVVVESLNST